MWTVVPTRDHQVGKGSLTSHWVVGLWWVGCLADGEGDDSVPVLACGESCPPRGLILCARPMIVGYRYLYWHYFYDVRARRSRTQS